MDAEERTDDVAGLLSRILYTTLLDGADAWAKLHLTMPQLKVVMLLGRHGSAPVSWLAGRLGVSPPNVTGILDRLEQQGWVHRTNDPRDRRVVRVALTSEGARLLRELHAAGDGQLRTLAGRLDPDDRAALHRGLTALLNATDREEGRGKREE